MRIDTAWRLLSFSLLVVPGSRLEEGVANHDIVSILVARRLES